MLNSSAHATQVLLKNDYNGLMSFFKNTWRDPSDTWQYEYRVYLAQKCFNLNELFFFIACSEAAPDEAERLFRIRKTFLSQTGLIMQAEKLAKFYQENRRFPRILICDELLKTGHDFMDTVMSVSRAVADELYGPVQDSTSPKLRLLSARLFEAIDFYSYMHSADDKILLTSSCRSNLRLGKEASASEWVAFVQNTSASIVFSGLVENTSFMPSFRISRELYHAVSENLHDQQLGWKRESWKYWNKTTVVWQRHNYGASDSVYWQQALRCSFHNETGEYSITPYLFWNALSDEESELLYVRIAQLLRAHADQGFAGSEKALALNNLLNIFSCEKPYAKDIKSQLMLSLASVLLFCRLAGDAPGSTPVQKELLSAKSDLEKVSQCFGTIGDIFPAFQALINEDCGSLRSALWNVLRAHLIRYARPLCLNDRCDTKNGRDSYLLAAVRHLLTVDAEQQEMFQYRRVRQINYDSISKYYEPDGFFHDYLNSFPAEYVSLDRKIGALLVLLFWNVTGTTVRRRDPANADIEAYFASDPASGAISDIYLNVGESTQIARAIYMLRFVPALSRIEKLCKDRHFSVRNMVFHFGSYLDNKLNSEDYAKAFLDFYDWCKEAGRSLSDWSKLDVVWLNQPDNQCQVRTRQEWNGGAWPAEVYADTGSMRLLDYLLWEEKQRINYLQESRSFMPDKA